MQNAAIKLIKAEVFGHIWHAEMPCGHDNLIKKLGAVDIGHLIAAGYFKTATGQSTHIAYNC